MRSMSATSPDDDSEYQTDVTSIEDDAERGLKLQPGLMINDETWGDEPVRPPEFYRAHASQVNKTKITNIFADSTNLQLNRVESEWRQYCAWVEENPEKLINTISLGDISSFFTWKLDQRRGAAGRRLRGIKESSSLATYRKTFLGVYRKLVGKDMDSKMARGTLIETVKLARDYGLSHTPRAKPPMDAQDVLEITQTTLTTVEKMFQVGRYRIQTCFFIQGGFITANRPDALLKLRYRDIKVTVLRNPNGGPHNILLEWTYEFTKSFLGPKAPNTFPIPEIIFDPSLVLSPHIFLLGLMFADNAFSIPELTPEHLFQLDIRPGCKSLEVPIKEEMAELCIFRQYKRTATKCMISSERLPYSTLKAHMKDVGEITGFKDVAKPYCLRYGAANAFDKDGNTSVDLRNLIMKHSTTDVFLKHYLSTRITTDAQAVVRGFAPQELLIQAACRMSRWIDPLRPRYLTKEQNCSVAQDPRILKLELKKAKMKKLSPDYKKLQRDIYNEKQRLRHALRIRVRKEWDRTQAEKDIRQQLSGKTFEEKIKTDLRRSPERTPQHLELIESIMSLPGSSLAEEIQRRSKAIRAVAAYCHFEEGGMSRHQRSGPRANDGPRETVEIDEVTLKMAQEAVKKERRPTICFVCLGNEQLTLTTRTHRFYTSGDLTRHFKKHVVKVNDSEGVDCNICQVHLVNSTHLQRHAFDAHGTVS